MAMTVCIAALAEDKKKLYAMCDCMISLNAPLPYQYETKDVPKIIELSDKALMMIAGNTLFGNEIAQIAQAKVEADDSMPEVAEKVRASYQEYRLRLIEEAALKPRQLTLAEYIEKQLTINQEVVNSIENALTETNIEVDIIVAGHDDSECHIYTVTHPGVVVSNDSIGYACVGIGAPHAQLHFIDGKYEKNQTIAKVKDLVKEAKTRSENAPGVGKESIDIVLPKTGA
jgi:20S proteasome alpha/beta subunit